MRRRFVSIALGAFVICSCATNRMQAPPPQEDPADDKEKSAADESPPPADEGPPTVARILETYFGEEENLQVTLENLEKIGIDNMDRDSQLVYAALLRSEGRLDDSRELLETLLAAHPDHAEAWFNLALTEHAAGQDEARNRALEMAISADDALAQAHAFKGDLALADSEWAKAEQSYKKALELNPQSLDALTGLAWAMAQTERDAEALKLLDRAVELDPMSVYARVDRSRLNVVLRNYNAAEDDLDFVIEKEPDVPWHYLDRARIRLRHFKDHDGARSDLETVERLDPENFFALLYLAGLHDEERRFTEAHDYYKRVVAMKPDYIWAFMPMGKLAWISGDYDSAAKWYAKAGAEDPEEFSFQMMEALSRMRSGRSREARVLFQEVMRRFQPGETGYEVARFCAERGTDYYAVNALNKEEDETLRERLWFYMGAVYETENNLIGAAAVYERISARKGHMEYDLAWAMLNDKE